MADEQHPIPDPTGRPALIPDPAGRRNTFIDPAALARGEEVLYVLRQGQTLEEFWAEHDAMIAAAAAPEPVRRLVPKSLIVSRLQAAGRLAAARAALDADLYARERWYAPDKPAIYADDPEALALLSAIGADPEAILAP